jgi:hypothetical protein
MNALNTVSTSRLRGAWLLRLLVTGTAVLGLVACGDDDTTKPTDTSLDVNFDGIDVPDTIGDGSNDTNNPNVVKVFDFKKAVGDDGKPNPKLPKRPAFAANSLSIEVPPTLRTLSVVATPKALRIEPGANTGVSVVVKDAAGKPVANAEVSVIVVDEAVLALTGHSYPDPVAAFYSSRGADTNAWHLKNNVLLAALSELYGAAGNLGAEQALAEAAESDMRKSVRREGADGFAGGGPPPPMPAPSPSWASVPRW